MALITCPECNKEVSDKATACPNCGAPLNEKQNKKFCQHCGEQIDKDCVICPKCGKQVGELKNNEKNIVINNNNNATAAVSNAPGLRVKNKWVSFFLCLFLGFLGIHKFYEGKIIMGIVYIFTLGLFGIGCLVDLIIILFKPHYYY